MSILSKEFLIFVTIITILYYGPFKRFQWQLLLLASYAFYIINEPIAVIYLLITTLSTYFIALKLDDYNKILEDKKTKLERKAFREYREKAQKKKRTLLLFVLILNFGMLSIFKYSSYIYSLIGIKFLPTDVYNTGLDLLLKLGLPLGISFYIFQSTGYLIDVYRNREKAQRNIFKYALFVSYFPQMIQGPIGRYFKLAPQLYSKKDINYSQIKYGLILMIWGYFKKIIISDRVIVIVNTIFGDYTSYSGWLILFSVLAYGIQIYTDFSGGIDVVRGVSQILGIKMSINFKQPFFAYSISDFWRRWHITLGVWLREYVFYPLNLSKPMAKLNRSARKTFGNERGKFISIVISTFVIYFIVGIWHGAGLKYIAFGIWNGTLISLSLFFEEDFKNIKTKLNIDDKNKFYKLFMIIRTNILVVLGRYFTRSKDFKTAVNMIKHTFRNLSITGVRTQFINLPIKTNDWLIIFISLIILFSVDYQSEKGRNLVEESDNWPIFIEYTYILLASIFLIYGIIYADGFISSEFIYKGY